MDEPLIGSRKRVNVSFNPALYQIPEDVPADDPAPPPPLLSSSIKERLIFGSPDLGPGFVWRDYDATSEEAAGEVHQPLISDDHESVCTCGNGYRESKASSNEGETDVKPFDDSFVDNRSIGSYWSARRLLPTLTRLDLDGVAAVFGSPGSRFLSSPIARPTKDDERGIPCGSAKAVQRGSGAETAKQSHSITVQSDTDSKTAECIPCKKKQLHRSKTAPAMTAMSGKPQVAIDLKRPPTGPSTTVVSQAFIGLMLYLAVGVIIYIWRENEFSGSSTHGFIDALYFCIVTMCTIGYGDITPTTPVAKLFSCVFVLVGFGFIDVLLSGMVSYVLDRQETLLLSAVAAGHHETAKNYLVDIKKGRMRIRSKVALAFGVVIMCIGVGTLVMHYLESLGWLDSFYLACMSVTTVGYGDNAFTTLPGRLFASFWLLVSTLAVARSFLYLTEARIDKRHRLIAKWVLEKEMTVGDLVAADLDNDGCVSKSDFVVFKLKEMGKIEEKDILEVCRQFNRLDSENSGKITLSCLINHHQEATAEKS